MLCLVNILGKIEPLTVIGSIICISAICHLSRNDIFEKKSINSPIIYFNNAPNTTNFENIITKLIKRRKIEGIVSTNRINDYLARNKKNYF